MSKPIKFWCGGKNALFCSSWFKSGKITLGGTTPPLWIVFVAPNLGGLLGAKDTWLWEYLFGVVWVRFEVREPWDKSEEVLEPVEDCFWGIWGCC